jgi:uncharacterized damage-inducible protein DinB
MFNGGAWHGPSVLDMLADVDAGTAAAYPIPGAHSIWELVLHLIATQAILLRRLRGETAGLKDEEFWLAVPPASEPAWKETVERLKRQEAELRQAISTYPEERLDARLTAEGSTAYNSFHGHVQHNAYHAGQIGLLKKCIRSRKEDGNG